MGFFKDLRDDISQAVNELLPDDDFFGIEEEDNEKEELLHLEEETEKSVNEEVQEDILAALAHLGDNIAAASDKETIEIESANEEIIDNQEESFIAEEVQAELPEESVMEPLADEELSEGPMDVSSAETETCEENMMEDVLGGDDNQMPEMDLAQEVFDEGTPSDGLELQEMEFELSDDMETEHFDMESFEIREEVEVPNELEDLIPDNIEIQNEELEPNVDEAILEETDFQEQELLEEELTPEFADLESDLVALDLDTMEEADMEPEELQDDHEDALEEFDNIQVEIGEIAEVIPEDITNKEEEEIPLTNMQDLDTMEEEKEEESINENLEDVSMIEDLDTFMKQQGDEDSMARGKKTEVLEPMIEENIIEKEENIMENNLENVQATDQVTVITKGTVITGSISSDGGLEVNGTITGDVECLGKLTINGNVSGNLKAAEVVVSTPRLDGGINSQSDVKIGVGTIVVGDVIAKSATISGAVKGEIDVQGPVVVDSTAIVKGNITAKSVQINNGAVVDGYCKLSYAEVDIDNFFDGE